MKKVERETKTAIEKICQEVNGTLVSYCQNKGHYRWTVRDNETGKVTTIVTSGSPSAGQFKPVQRDVRRQIQEVRDGRRGT